MLSGFIKYGGFWGVLWKKGLENGIEISYLCNKTRKK